MIIDDRYRECRRHVLALLEEYLRKNGEYNSANKIAEYARWHEEPMIPPKWFTSEGSFASMVKVQAKDSEQVDFNNAGAAYSDADD